MMLISIQQIIICLVLMLFTFDAFVANFTYASTSLIRPSDPYPVNLLRTIMIVSMLYSNRHLNKTIDLIIQHN
jgi:hypothetical protein